MTYIALLLLNVTSWQTETNNKKKVPDDKNAAVVLLRRWWPDNVMSFPRVSFISAGDRGELGDHTNIQMILSMAVDELLCICTLHGIVDIRRGQP